MSNRPIGPWTETQDQTTSRPFNFGGCTIIANPLNSWGSGFYVPGTFIPYEESSVRGSFSFKQGVNNGKGPFLEPSPCVTEFRNSGPLAVFGFELSGNSASLPALAGVKCTVTGVCRPILYNDHVAGFDELLTTTTNKAYMKLAQKLSGVLAETGVLSGEMKETYGTVKHAVELIGSKTNNVTQSLGRAYKNIRGGNFAPVVQEVADLFLEYQFGVKPLVTDIGNVLDAVAQLGNNTSSYRHINGTYASDILSHETFPTDSFYWPGIYCDRSSTRKCTIVVKMGATYDVRLLPEEILPDYRSKFGFDSQNLLPTVYNLTPYTWVVDYFTNASDFVNAFAFRRGLLRYGYTVTLVKSVSRHTYNFRTGPDFVITGPPESAAGTSENFYFNRVPTNHDAFVPSFEFRTPQLGQVANLFALGASRAASGQIRAEKQNPRLSQGQLETFVNLIRHNFR